MDSFDGDGVFWRASDPETRVAGRLAYSHDGGATLELLGTFGSPLTMFESGDDQPHGTRILGFASGKAVTLEDCVPTGGTLHGQGLAVQRWQIPVALVGHHWADGELIEFDTLVLGFDSLIQWLGKSGIGVRFEFTDDGQTLQRLEAIQTPVPEDEARTDTATVTAGLGWGAGGDRIEEFHLRQNAYIKLRYDEQQGLDELRAAIGPVRDLLALCADAPAAIQTVSATHSALKHGGSEIPLWVDILFQASTPLADSPQPAHKMLFTYDQIGGISTLARWIPLAATRGVVLGALLSVQYGSSLYAENRFQNTIAAAESLSRLRGPNQVEPKTQFRARCREIVANAPEGDRAWLKGLLQYANEPRLRDRLSNLVEFAGDSFTAIVEDTAAWIGVVVDTRNRMVHHDSRKPVQANASDLYFLAESIYLLVLLGLLREAGVDAAVLATAKDNQQIGFTGQRVRETVARLRALNRRRQARLPNEE